MSAAARRAGTARPSLARLRLAAVAAVLVTGCAAPTQPGGPPPTEAAVAAVDDLAVAQRSADDQLSELLAALQAAEDVLDRIRRPASATTAADQLEDATAQLGTAPLGTADDELAQVAAAAAAARAALDEARSWARDRDDRWLVEYLAAEIRVVDQVDDHAAAGAEVQAAAEAHLPVLRTALDEAAAATAPDGVEEGTARAVAAEDAIAPHTSQLERGRTALAEAVERRSATAAQVNAASADAAAVAERRPGS